MRDYRGCDVQLISSRLGRKAVKILFEKAKAVTAKDKGGKKLIIKGKREPTFFPGMHEVPHGKAR